LAPKQSANAILGVQADFRRLNPRYLQITLRVNLDHGALVAHLEQYQLLLCSNESLGLSLIAAAPASQAARSARAYWVYVGANTLKNSKGIYVSKLEAKSGAFTEPRLAAET
jgi:hypothetical protein